MNIFFPIIFITISVLSTNYFAATQIHLSFDSKPRVAQSGERLVQNIVCNSYDFETIKDQVTTEIVRRLQNSELNQTINVVLPRSPSWYNPCALYRSIQGLKKLKRDWISYLNRAPDGVFKGEVLHVEGDLSYLEDKKYTFDIDYFNTTFTNRIEAPKVRFVMFTSFCAVGTLMVPSTWMVPKMVSAVATTIPTVLSIKYLAGLKDRSIYIPFLMGIPVLTRLFYTHNIFPQTVAILLAFIAVGGLWQLKKYVKRYRHRSEPI